MKTLVITTGLIALLSIYLAYRLISSKPIDMALDQGGRKSGDVLLPDFDRNDVNNFINECRDKEIREDIAKEFLIAMYNTMNFVKEPPAPQLKDNRYEVWGLDDDIEDPINYVLKSHNAPLIRWNYEEVASLITIEDILNFIIMKIEQ